MDAVDKRRWATFSGMASLLFVSAAWGQAAPTRCASMLDVPSLARRSGPAFKYPEAAFAAGHEGTVGFQYHLIDASGKVAIDCVYQGSGDEIIDAAVVERVNSSRYHLPKGFEWERDKGRRYQDTAVLSWNAESLARADPATVAAAIAERLIHAPEIPGVHLAYAFEGTTNLRARVNDSGSVEMVSMLQSSGDTKLDAIAMAAMLAYKFKPGDPFSVDRAFSFKIN
ncbi:TonB family protein [Rhizobacter sp. OV335]|jgi:TonB family protein|uniref:TonB family protein n=1 Tax=Rhizobacter sp. OV335 TaxID=1500264 RepID=UPI0009F8BB85|nr:TonB family protein [Rhizobacter sp. OV335]